MIESAILAETVPREPRKAGMAFRDLDALAE
jgi:hypothetical protein